MSLINDALKKAQNRHGDSTPPGSAGAGPAAIPMAPRKGKSPLGKILLIGAGIALLSAAVSAAVILLFVRRDPPPAAPLPQPAVAIQPPTASPVTQASSASPSPLIAKPADPQPTASPIAPAAVEPVSRPTATAPSIPAAPPPEPAAPPAIKLGTRIQSFIDRLRITSIRISDTGNKAILNDRLFRINDLVEPSLGLRLTDIQPSQLTFTDETGATYLRRF